MTHQAHSKFFAATGLIPVARLFAGIFTLLCCVAPMAWAASTTTTLAVTSNGNAVTTVASGSVATLTAMVKTGSKAVTVGQVNFCDAAAKYCTDIHLLGMAQLTSAGTAVLKFRPGIGSHSYKAVFIGTKSNAGSSSSVSALSVTGKSPTSTLIESSGNVGNYTLTATIGGNSDIAPTGMVSFLDTSNGNSVLDTANLGAATTGVQFLNTSNPATGNYPFSIAVGDINGDGITDLVVANYNSLPVTILLGNGDGTFTATSKSPIAESEPDFIAVGDFNGDGIPDLAVADYDISTITILLGNGDGTFTAASASPATGSAPEAIAVGDFNGDGIPDLAVANFYSNTITILLGNGDGTFTAASASPATGGEPNSIAVGDFNEDGIQDLAVANYCGNESTCNYGDTTTNGTVTILLGKGDGTFTAASASPATGGEPTSIAVGDFNGDGIPDLAVANSKNKTVTILLCNGDGTFTAASASPATGSDPRSITVGDFNGDDIPDLAVANNGSRTVTILLGDGDGTFTAASASPATGIYPVSIAAGDFNGDGISDLAVTSSNNYPGEITVLLTENQTANATASGISTSGFGTHLIEASYPGDSNYGPSVSGAIEVIAVTKAALTSPTPGSTLPGSSVIFSWTTGSGVTAYKFFLGTTGPGSYDLYNSQSTTATSAKLTGLPTLGLTLYARLSSEIGGRWSYTDYTYTEYPLATLISPAPGSVLGTSSTTFSWTSIAGVTAYQLNLGTMGPGSYDLIAPIGQKTTSRTVPSFPANGVTVYARLYSKIAGVWKYNDFTYTESGTAAPPAPATLQTPAPGSVLGTSSITFSWTPGSQAWAYQLNLGTKGPGSYDLIAPIGQQTTSRTIPSLPANGATVYARLYSKIAGFWKYNDYTYTESGKAALTPTKPD